MTATYSLNDLTNRSLEQLYGLYRRFEFDLSQGEQLLAGGIKVIKAFDVGGLDHPGSRTRFRAGDFQASRQEEGNQNGSWHPLHLFRSTSGMTRSKERLLSGASGR